MWRSAPTKRKKRRRRKRGLFSSWFRRKASKEKSGRQSPAMRRAKAICRAENKHFYGSKYPVCERCGAHRGRWFPPWKRRFDHVDHIKPWAHYPKLRYAQKNLQILCDMHNGKKSDKIGMPNWKSWNRCWIRRWFLPFKRIWARVSHGYW